MNNKAQICVNVDKERWGEIESNMDVRSNPQLQLREGGLYCISPRVGLHKARQGKTKRRSAQAAWLSGHMKLSTNRQTERGGRTQADVGVFFPRRGLK